MVNKRPPRNLHHGLRDRLSNRPEARRQAAGEEGDWYVGYLHLDYQVKRPWI